MYNETGNKKDEIISGRNPVLEALRAKRSINRIYIQKGQKHGALLNIISLAKKEGIIFEEAEKQFLNELCGSQYHQGVAAAAAAHDYVNVDDILDNAEKKGEKPFILIMDKITDPHNMGAVIRSADSAGAHGIIIPKRRSCPLNATVAKCSAGAYEYVPVARVTNLTAEIKKLKDKGLWIIGTDAKAKNNIYNTNLKGAVGIVIGSEGSGISRLVKESCDMVVSIPLKGRISSLNASCAASVIMFEILRQRQIND